MPENSSSGSQVDWGVVQGMIGTVFAGIGTIVSASNQNSTVTTSAGETYQVTNDGSGGFQASGPVNGNGGNGNGNGWGFGAIAPSTLVLLAVAAVAVLALR